MLSSIGFFPDVNKKMFQAQIIKKIKKTTYFTMFNACRINQTQIQT